MLLQLFLSGKVGRDPKRHVFPIPVSECAPSFVWTEQLVNPLWALVPLFLERSAPDAWVYLEVQREGRGSGLGDLSSLDDARLRLTGWAGGTPLQDKGISDRFSLLSGEELIRPLRLPRLS